MYRHTTVKWLAMTVATMLYANAFAQDAVKTYFPKQTVTPQQLPGKNKVWIFLLAGQSNMAGRGLVEPQDTIPDQRILTINQQNEVVLAKEPLHYYEPSRTGLDCGMSFARTLLKSVPEDVTLLLVPVAVGGSSVQQWLGDSTWRDVKLLTNAKEKISALKNTGTFKGVLWHQGESNANTTADIMKHRDRLAEMARTFRNLTRERKLPFLVAELGSFSKSPELFGLMNRQLALFADSDRYTALIKTGDLTHKGDFLHFDGPSQRRMGERFAEAYVMKFL